MLYAHTLCAAVIRYGLKLRYGTMALSMSGRERLCVLSRCGLRGHDKLLLSLTELDRSGNVSVLCTPVIQTGGVPSSIINYISQLLHQRVIGHCPAQWPPPGAAEKGAQLNGISVPMIARVHNVV